MKAGYRRDRARARGAARRRLPAPPGDGCRSEALDWQARPRAPRPRAGAARAPGALRRPARPHHRRRRLDRPCARDASSAASGPSRSTLARRPRGVADGRPARARAATLDRAHVLCDVRDTGRVEREVAPARGPTSSSTSPPTSTWTGPRLFPEEFVDTNLQGSWNVLRAADRAGRRTRSSSPRPTRRRWPRASTGGRSGSWSSSPRSRRARPARGGSPSGSSTCSAAPAARLRALPPPGARRRAADGHRHAAWCATGSRWRTPRRSPHTARCSPPKGRCSQPPPIRRR